MTDADCQRHLVILRHLGARITLAEEVARERQEHLETAALLDAVAQHALVEIGELHGRVVLLDKQYHRSLKGIASNNHAEVELSNFLARFIPLPAPADTTQMPLVSPSTEVAPATETPDPPPVDNPVGGPFSG